MAQLVGKHGLELGIWEQLNNGVGDDDLPPRESKGIGAHYLPAVAKGQRRLHMGGSSGNEGRQQRFHSFAIGRGQAGRREHAFIKAPEHRLVHPLGDGGWHGFGNLRSDRGHGEAYAGIEQQRRHQYRQEHGAPVAFQPA
jgi:hypothetical protein